MLVRPVSSGVAALAWQAAIAACNAYFSEVRESRRKTSGRGLRAAGRKLPRRR